MTKIPFVKLLLQSLAIAFFLGLIIRYFLHHREEWHLLATISPGYGISAAFCIVVLNVVAAYKFLLILRHLGINKISFLEWFKIFTISRFINFHIIQGANIYRLAKLKKDYEFSYTRTVGATILFAWLELLLMLLLGVIFLAISKYALQVHEIRLLPLLGTVLFLVAGTPFLAYKLVDMAWLDKSRVLSQFRRRLKDIVTPAVQYTRNFRLLSRFVALTLFSLALCVFLMQICFRSLHVSISLEGSAIFTLVFLFTRSVNIVPGNIGLAEIVCGYFSKMLGVTMGAGIIVSVLLRVLNYVTLGMLGLLLNFVFPKR